MIFTEKEAAAKRCTPMQIIWLMPDADERRGMEAAGGLEVNCIGSRCAQWRWYDSPDSEGNSAFPRQRNEPGEGAYACKGSRATKRGIAWRDAPARGFCGMAGRVE